MAGSNERAMEDDRCPETGKRPKGANNPSASVEEGDEKKGIAQFLILSVVGPYSLERR